MIVGKSSIKTALDSSLKFTYMFCQLRQLLLANRIFSIEIRHIFLRFIAHSRRIAAVRITFSFGFLSAQKLQNMAGNKT